MATAFQLACEKGDNVTVTDFDDVFQSEDAFAFAAVRIPHVLCPRRKVLTNSHFYYLVDLAALHEVSPGDEVPYED